MRRLWFGVLVALTMLLPVRAQDGLNLPTELYILLNEGLVERYGLGIAGVDRVTPADEFVLDFRVSPDGNWLAYRTESGLFLREMYDEPADTRQIEAGSAGIPPLRGMGETIAWSPDSAVLAYTTETGVRFYFFDSGAFTAVPSEDALVMNIVWSSDGSHLAAQAGDNWLILRREGASIITAAILLDATGVSWFGGAQLIYTPTTGGLRYIDVSNQNQQRTLLDASARYFLPFVTDDNRVKLFRGEPLAAELVALDISDLSITALGAAQLDLSGLRWAPRGNLAIAFQGGALAVVDPASGNGFTLPVTQASAYSWGPTYPPPVASLPLPTAATFLALDANAVQQVWRLPVSDSDPALLTSAANGITEYALSPDSRRMAYVSNSGLWVVDLDGQSDPRELLMLGISEGVMPAWSPEGVLYYRDEQPEGAGIWRVTPAATDDSSPELFLTDADDTNTYRQPRLAENLNAMLVNRGDALVLVDTTNSAESYLGQYTQARWISGTMILASGNPMLPDLNTQGLYTLDVNNREGTTTFLVPTVGEFRTQDFRLLDDGIVRFLLQRGDFAETRVLDIPQGGGAITVVGNAGYITMPQLVPDGSAVVGYTHPGGALLSYDVASGQRRLLNSFPQVEQLEWVP